MNQLTVELPEHIYKQLAMRAEKQQKLPEQLATEKLIAEFGVFVQSKSRATEIAKDFLRSCIGDALVPQNPFLNKKRTIWQVPITIELIGRGNTEVGKLEIDTKTGTVRTKSPAFSALWKQFRALLGIEDFPPAKQARLSGLLELGNDGALTPEQKDELDQLMKEADTQEAENLQRLANRLPSRKRKDERCC